MSFDSGLGRYAGITEFTFRSSCFSIPVIGYSSNEAEERGYDGGPSSYAVGFRYVPLGGHPLPLATMLSFRLEISMTVEWV